MYPLLKFPWVGKAPWRRTWQPTLVLLPGESHGQRRLLGYSPWGHRVGHDRVTLFSLSVSLVLHLVSPQHVSELTQAVSVSRERQAARLRQQTLVSPASGSWKSEPEQGGSFVAVLVRAFLLVCAVTRPLGPGVCSWCCHGGPTVRAASDPRYPQIVSHWALGLQHVDLRGLAGADFQSAAARVLAVGKHLAASPRTKPQPQSFSSAPPPLQGPVQAPTLCVGLRVVYCLYNSRCDHYVICMLLCFALVSPI